MLSNKVGARITKEDFDKAKISFESAKKVSTFTDLHLVFSDQITLRLGT
jgi:hypothetical protein